MRLHPKSLAIIPPSKSSIEAAVRYLRAPRPRWSWIGEGNPPAVASNLLGASLDIQQRVIKLSFELRQEYIDYIGTISRNQDPDWWRSPVSEKNPYYSNTFFHACCIKGVIDALNEADDAAHVLIIQNAALRRALLHNLKDANLSVRLLEPPGYRLRNCLRRAAGIVAHDAYFWYRNASRIALARYWRRLHATRAVRSAVSNETPLSVTNIWIDLRAYSLETGEFADVDFGDIAELLRSRGKTVAGLPNILNSASYASVAAYIARSNSLYLAPHAFLRMLDVFACIWYALIRVPRWQAMPPFAGLNVSELIFDDLLETWYTQRDAEHALIERWIARFKKSGIRIERFIYAFENHTWERVICNALRAAYPAIQLIGYQPNGLPMLLLNYFISRSESIPLPSRIIANGEYSARLLADCGFGERVLCGGGLRQKYLQDVLYGHAAAPIQRGGRARVLVTPSIGRYRTVELVYKTVEAFREIEDFDITIKFHPSMRPEQIKPFFGPLLMPSHIEISTQPILELLQKTDLLIYNDGTFPAAEALAFGIPVIFVEPEYGVPLDSLDGFADMRPAVRTASEIRETAAVLLKTKTSAHEIAARKEVARRLVGHVTQDTLELFT